MRLRGVRSLPCRGARRARADGLHDAAAAAVVVGETESRFERAWVLGEAN